MRSSYDLILAGQQAFGFRTLRRRPSGWVPVSRTRVRYWETIEYDSPHPSGNRSVVGITVLTSNCNFRGRKHSLAGKLHPKVRSRKPPGVATPKKARSATFRTLSLNHPRFLANESPFFSALPTAKRPRISSCNQVPWRHDTTKRQFTRNHSAWELMTDRDISTV
jgi:hypothetical protein